MSQANQRVSPEPTAPTQPSAQPGRQSQSIFLSVVMPLFNKQAFVCRSIDSVLSQHFTNFEFIVVDDGSTDASRSYVNSYTDERIKLITQTNQGPGAARNLGIHYSTGQWIAFIDADDAWADDHLDELVRIIKRCSRAGIVATRITTPRQRPAVSRTAPHVLGKINSLFSHIREIDFFCSAARNVVVVHSSCVAIERSVFEQVGYFECWNKHEDEQLWARICFKFRCAVSTKRTAYYFRGTGGVMDASHADRTPRRNAITQASELGPAVALVLEQWRSTGRVDPMRASLSRYINSRVSIPLRGNFYRGDSLRAKQISQLYVPPLRGTPLLWYCLLMLPLPMVNAVARCRMATRRYYHGVRKAIRV